MVSIMTVSATRQFLNLVLRHRDQLLDAAQVDFDELQQCSKCGHAKPDTEDTAVQLLKSELQPYFKSGEFFSAHDAAISECAAVGQLVAFGPLITRVKHTYWKCWDASIETSIDARPTIRSKDFADLSRQLAELDDILPALEAATGVIGGTKNAGAQPDADDGQTPSWIFEPGLFWFEGTKYECTPVPLEMLKYMVENRARTAFDEKDFFQLRGADSGAITSETIGRHMGAVRGILRQAARDIRAESAIIRDPLPKKKGGWRFLLPRE
jgi:hypothetical protein